MGGPCNAEITGNSSEEIRTKGMEHVEAVHPEMVGDIKKMSQEETDKWNADLDQKFEAAPLIAA